MKVIISGLVWLPVNELQSYQLENIRRDLVIFPKKTTDIQAKENPSPIFLYQEDEERGLIGVPRQYYLEKKSEDHEEILDISYGSPMHKLETNYTAEGPYEEQGVAIESLQDALEGKKWGGVLLRADAAFGKTYSSVEFARRLGRKTLVLVHKEFLLNQWKEAINELMPKANVGIIQQNRCEYDYLDSNGKEPDFVIGLLQSLAKEDGNKYPKSMYYSFGLIVSDEVHRISAPTFGSVIPMFNAAYRLGVSATPKRLDGAEDVFFKHISPVTYSAKTKLMTPKLRKIYTSADLKPISRGSYHVAVKDLNSAQVLSQLSSNEFRTRDIVDDLVKAVVAGRKILVISERLEHLRAMSWQLGSMLFDMELPFVPKIDFCTGQWFTGDVWEETTRGKGGKILHRKGEPKFKKRSNEELKKAEEANVIMGTKKLIEEGFNLLPLDVLVLAVPMGNLEQMVGRVQRWCMPKKEKCNKLCSWRAGKCTGKPQPLIVDVIDEDNKKLIGKFSRRLQFYRKIGAVD